MVPPPPTKSANDYLGDMDLPSSESEPDSEDEQYKPNYTAEDKDSRTFNSMVCPQ